MKTLTVATLLLILTSAVSVQAQTNWMELLTMSGTKVSAVHGATQIDIATAKAMHDEGRLFLDVQGYFEWRRSHVPGAIRGSSINEEKLAEIADKNEKIVFYCNCDLGSDTCNLSPNASAQAASWGYKNIYYFTNYNEWDMAGYSTEQEN
jgi:rhodanese-related sulfurtransferase